MEAVSAVTITELDLARHLEEATQKILAFPFRAAAPAAPPATDAVLGGRRVAYRPLQGVAGPGGAARAEQDLRLAERIQQIHPGDLLYTDVEHHVLRVLRRGIQVFLRIEELYELASGLDRLKAANQGGTLGPREEPELAEKVETAAAVGLFALHCYVLAMLRDYQRDATDRLAFEVAPPADLPLEGKLPALHAALYHLYQAIEAHARDDASLVKAVRDAARSAAGRLAALQHSLQHVEFYTRYRYRIEADEIAIAGFELPEPGVAEAIEVPLKRPEDVVGNHVAKLEAIRVAQRLACYDPARRENPFVDLGGFVFSFIGDGSPGTGKTTLIQMIVSLLREYTRVAGVPLRYENFSVDEISDYQGRSGQNAKRFCQTLLDPRGVGFGTIDDVDQVCGSRHDRNASAGQLEVTAVFMQQLGGAKTMVRGNTTFGLFSNHPEKVDDALRQRMQARFLVDGPRTREDYTDLLHLLLRRDFELPLGPGYQPFVTQELRRVIEAKYAEHDVPRAPALRGIFDAVVGRLGADGRLSTWKAFGEYLHALAEHDPRFTGRAVKNITDAVRARMMDFDLPAEWLEKRDAFFAKPWETRLAMIAELRGKVTPAMVIQEIHRYADSEARYTNAADERELESRTRQILLETRARRAAAEREPGA